MGAPAPRPGAPPVLSRMSTSLQCTPFSQEELRNVGQTSETPELGGRRMHPPALSYTIKPSCCQLTRSHASSHILEVGIWCFADKWSMHVCECKRLPRWTDVRMSIRSSLTWLQGTDCVPSAIAPGITGESHSHPLAHGKTWD